jgi:hypothetical protein
MDLQETEWEGMDWVNLTQEQVVGFCKHGIEPSGSIKLRAHFLTRQNTASQDGLCSRKLVIKFADINKFASAGSHVYFS